METPERGNAEFALMAAVADVERIRALWRKHYDGRWQRRGITKAETFAARRWGIKDVEHVVDRSQHPSGAKSKRAKT